MKLFCQYMLLPTALPGCVPFLAYITQRILPCSTFACFDSNSTPDSCKSIQHAPARSANCCDSSFSSFVIKTTSTSSTCCCFGSLALSYQCAGVPLLADTHCKRDTHHVCKADTTKKVSDGHGSGLPVAQTIPRFQKQGLVDSGIKKHI